MSTNKTVDRDFESLLDQLKQSRGFDFTGYKRTTLMRRVQKRMHDAGFTEFSAYADYLEVHPDEFHALFNTILINVTSFFRDHEAWQVLADEVIAPLAAEEPRAIRVWSAGCASGEETYTLIMLLAEALGVERVKKTVKVYATDADNEALNVARHARYRAQQLEAVPAQLRERYFENNNDDSVTFRNDLRRSVIFGEHDLVQDAPISRIDLLVCRNTLIYFNSETQGRIIARFHFALAPGGHILLGRSEMLLAHSRLFEPVNMQARIFRKLGRRNLRDQLMVLAQSGDAETSDALGQHLDLRDASLDAGAIAQVVVDRNGVVVLANQQARVYFGITLRDIGRPIQDLEVSYRPIEIRSLIDKVYESGETLDLIDVEYRLPHGELRYYDIHIVPLPLGPKDVGGVSISYAEVTAHHRLREELERSNQEAETAYEELQATNEELETTNEELQSTIEELETTNEELQSTNEELETMNEELHSTNEELETINTEFQRRTNQLNQVNAFLGGIMSSMRAGVAVTDRDMHVTLWNPRAEDLWGLRNDEVAGKVFTNLDIGLPIDQVAKLLRSCLEGKKKSDEAVVDAINRRGRAITCRVSCSRLVAPDETPLGLIIIMEEQTAKVGG